MLLFDDIFQNNFEIDIYMNVSIACFDSPSVMSYGNTHWKHYAWCNEKITVYLRLKQKVKSDYFSTYFQYSLTKPSLKIFWFVCLVKRDIKDNN